MVRLTFLGLALLVGCFSGRPIDSNLTCPCAPGWTCEPVRKLCVRGALDGGGDGASVRTVPLEIPARNAIARMTMLLWHAPPSSALLAEADASSAASNRDLLPFARRVLGDPQARVGVSAFYAQWLGLDSLPEKTAALFPQYTKELRDSMLAESHAFGVNVTLDEDGYFSTLLLARFSYVNEPLAAIYGVSGVVGTDLRKVSLDGMHRAGLFTQPAVMAFTSQADLTSPTSRGRFVLDKLFCVDTPPHPGTPPSLAPLPPQTSTRQALIKRLESNASCFVCHGPADSVGFAYEGLDAIGQKRDRDNGVDVDVSGHLPSDRGDFFGPVALASIAAGNADAQRCMARQWLAFALGRAPAAADMPSLDDSVLAFAASRSSLRDLIVAVLTSESFLAP
jgi:hypothetical protein